MLISPSPSLKGFYSVSGSSLSDSSYSVSSDAALAGAAPLTRAPKLWEQIALSADNPDILWTEGAVQQQQQEQQEQQQQEHQEQQEQQEQQQPAQQSRAQGGGETTLETPVPGKLVQSNSPYHPNFFNHANNTPPV